MHVTDRPTDSASPLLVPRRSFQLEAGYKFIRIGDDSGSTDAQVLPDLLARYGINKKVEARLVATGWTFQSGADDKATGFNDISLGANIHLAEESGRHPQMALLVDVSLPVGQSDITNKYVSPKVLFLGSNSLDDRLGLTYNVGPSFVTVDSDGESDTKVDLNYAVALSGSVGGPLNGERVVDGGIGEETVRRAFPVDDPPTTASERHCWAVGRWATASALRPSRATARCCRGV